MNSSITISEKTWNSIILTNTDPKRLLELFKFSIKIHTDYLVDGYNLYGYPHRTFTLEFQNKKSYTYFILKYGDLIRKSLD